MKKYLMLSLLFFAVACDEVRVKAKEVSPSEQGAKDLGFSGKYLKDGQGGLFTNAKWYFYSSTTHIIWPLYKIYVIKTPVQEYKMQIINYYGGFNGEAGNYIVNLSSASGDVQLIVDGKGCGNTFTNPDHAACILDPTLNVYTYLDLETQTVRKLTDDEALIDNDWDIAFKETDVRLNSGTSGPSTVVGGLLESFDYFLTGGFPDENFLKNTALQSQAITQFHAVTIPEDPLYFLPDGVDRVINEPQWFTNNGDHRELVSGNVWQVQSYDSSTATKVQFKSLTDLFDGDGYTTTLEIQANDSKIYTLDLSTTTKSLSYCLNFIAEEVFKCSPDRKDWDIKLIGLQLKKQGVWQRPWMIQTSSGAFLEIGN